MKRNACIFTMLMMLCLVACGDSTEKTNIVKSVEEQLEEQSDEMPPISEAEEPAARTFETSAGTSFYFGLEPIDEVAYDLLKVEFDQIDFTVEIEMGDKDTYDTYLQIYRQFMANERSYWNEYNRERYLRDIVPETDMESSDFYVFDVDGDGKQELYVRTYYNRMYVFKYDEADEQIHVWYQEKETPYYHLIGTQTKVWENLDGCYEFYKLDEDANEELTVTFEQFCDINPATQKSEMVYLVKLPKYASESSESKITAELQKQAYCIDGEYYFCITKDQYGELTADFFEAEEKGNVGLYDIEIADYMNNEHVAELYKAVQRKIDKIDEVYFEKPDYFGTTMYTKDNFEEIKQYEMNSVLEYLGLKQWSLSTSSGEEIGIPVDEPLGDYTLEKLMEYTDEEHDLTVEYFCGGSILHDLNNRYIASIIKEYDNARVNHLYFRVFDYGYLGEMAVSNAYCYDIYKNYYIKHIDIEKIAHRDISSYTHMWLDEVTGEVNLIYDIGEEERENPYGTYTSYEQSIWVKVKETESGYKVQEIIPMRLRYDYGVEKETM